MLRAVVKLPSLNVVKWIKDDRYMHDRCVYLTCSLPRDVYIRRKNDHAGGQGRVYVQPQFRFYAFVKALHQSLHHRCFLCSVDGPVKISTSGVPAGTQVVTALGAFAFKSRENRNFGAVICLNSVTFWSRGFALRVCLTLKGPSLPSESEITLPKMLATGVVVCENSPRQWMG